MYRIMCDRTPARELGSGISWLKEDGKIVEFATMEDAGAMVKIEVRSAELRRLSTRQENIPTIKINSAKYTLRQGDVRIRNLGAPPLKFLPSTSDRTR